LDVDVLDRLFKTCLDSAQLSTCGADLVNRFVDTLQGFPCARLGADVNPINTFFLARSNIVNRSSSHQSTSTNTGHVCATAVSDGNGVNFTRLVSGSTE